MDWSVDGQEYDPGYFRGFEIQGILIDVDGPRLFTARIPLCMVLFMLVDEDENTMRYIVVPTSESIVGKLEKGLITVRDALDQPLLWVVDTDFDQQPLVAWSTALARLPECVLPQRGRMLWPHQQPAFSLRAIGEGLSAGAVPASVIRQVVEGASTALRKAAAQVFEDTGKQGRARNSRRRLYDLPVQYIAYNSFEVAFSMPERQHGLFDNDDEVQQLGAALSDAIAASVATEDSDAGSLDALQMDLLEAVEKLVPPLSGVITEFEVGGTILGNDVPPFRLNRTVAKRVKCMLETRRDAEEKITTLKGLVSEMDRDNFSFTLRQSSDCRDHVCFFSAEMFDEVLDAFVHEHSVEISGRETLKNGNIDVSIFNKVSAKGSFA